MGRVHMSCLFAGLNVLRLLNETAATALCWGLPKTADLPEDSATPRHVLFFDMGHSSTQVCLVAFTKGKMSVLASAFDRNLGGRDVDHKILNHFAAQWQEKKKLNIHESPKAVLRLVAAIDKVKQQLSGYTSSVKLPINVECLQEDHDFSSSLSTDELEALVADLMVRALEPCKKVVTDAKLTFDQIDVIEVVGSATRSPLVTNAIKTHFGKEPQRTLNSEEAVSKGCALMGAMMSPNFKVREFAVVDCTPYPIALSWSPSPGAEKMEVEGGEAAATGKGNIVFTEHNVLPSTKMLTFMRSATFDITAAYADEAALAPGTCRSIGQSSITVPPPTTGEATKVKVKVRIDPNGVLSVESAQAVEEVEEEEPKVEPAPATNGDDVSMADAPPPGGAAPAGEGAEAPAAEPAGQPPAEEAKPPEPAQVSLVGAVLGSLFSRFEGRAP